MTDTATEELAALAELSLDELRELASTRRDQTTGSRITYSPKVFVPLTQLCRDRCGYCTFAQPPAAFDQPYLNVEQVLDIARSGAEHGCHEALFTLGERPEDRYEVARRWLREQGFDSTVHYLTEVCRLVREETGLLPHANAGALSVEELRSLRAVAPSQGMMLESLRADLACHRQSPDKTPERRLATLDAAGEASIAFTTGILVGIGEQRADRLAALIEIAAAHRRHGHIQEVIIQNFLPKPGTAMRDAPRCPSEEHHWTIAAARIVLPASIHVQAPPNLTDDLEALFASGIDDLGGLSPVTADHVNPERPWPHLDHLRERAEASGFTLAPRLTIYPEYAQEPRRWIDPALRFAVLDRSDAEGLARDDPGSVWPAASHPADTTVEGADITSAGRSEQWYSGAPHPPPELIGPARRSSATRDAVTEVIDGIRAGQRLDAPELRILLAARGPQVREIAAMADEIRRATVGDTVTWVHNRNINYTNVCTFKCRFCGFSKGPLSLDLRGAPYLLTIEEIATRVREASELGATEVTLQGGIHPKFDGEHYIEIVRAARAAAPGIHLHGFTALEVTEGARRLDEPLADYLRRLRDAGLGSLPGTAAEILDDEIRAVLCPDKIDTDTWLDCHRVAHEIGLRSNVTMMFGSIEHPEHWIRHLLRTRELQERTGGFTEFVGLPFVHMAAPIYLRRESRRGPTFRETLLIHAVARLAYRGLIDHVQASWVKVGVDGTRQLLQAGCDDLGGTLMEENISRAAGASHGQRLDRAGFADLVAPLGRPLRQRSTLYELI